MNQSIHLPNVSVNETNVSIEEPMNETNVSIEDLLNETIPTNETDYVNEIFNETVEEIEEEEEEPILDFDLDEFIEMIKEIKPTWVNIGADSKSHGLPEPTPEKIKKLIEGLKNITEIKLKDNFKRLEK